MGRVLKRQRESKHALPLVRQVVRTQVSMLDALTGPWRKEHCQQAQKHGTYQQVLMIVSLEYRMAFSHAIIPSIIVWKGNWDWFLSCAGGLTDNTSGLSRAPTQTRVALSDLLPLPPVLLVHLVLRSRAKERGTWSAKRKCGIMWTSECQVTTSAFPFLNFLIYQMWPTYRWKFSCLQDSTTGKQTTLRVGCMPSSRHHQKLIQWHLWGRVVLVS